jgi:DNA-binding MurR/RpiR family transcriptional regulator
MTTRGPAATTTPGSADARSIGDRITTAYPRLTPRERRVADFMLENLADLVAYNATELAQHSRVSKATVSRLFRHLGYEGSSEVREHVRALRARGVPVRTGTDPESPVSLVEREAQNLSAALAALAASDCARVLATARRVVVLGFRNGFPVALHLREQLLQARGGVSLAPQPGQSVAEELAGLDDADAIVIVGFRRRPALFDRVIAAAVATGATTVLIAEPGMRGPGASVDISLACPLENGSPFDSYAAAMTLVCALASEVLAETGEHGRARVESIDALYESLHELGA